MKNKDYFEYSYKHNDDTVDLSKQEGVLVITNHEHLPDTYLMKANHQLIELITTYKTLYSNKNLTTTINVIIDKIIDIIENTKLINYSAFCVYFQVIGYSYNTYIETKHSMSKKEKRELMKTLLNLYIKNRHNMYMFHGYSDQVLQIGSDASSSRRKSKTGIEKIEDFLIPLGFKKSHNINELNTNEYTYILPDKGQLNIFNQYLKDNNIKFKFRTSRDAKNPDMLLKIKNTIIIMEHKLTNGGGGSQNAEINEIIQFIAYGEKNIHFISCLSGNFFQKLNQDNQEPKSKSQYDNIIKNLTKYPQNFFVNGKGFEKLIKDFINN